MVDGVLCGFGDGESSGVWGSVAGLHEGSGLLLLPFVGVILSLQCICWLGTLSCFESVGRKRTVTARFLVLLLSDCPCGFDEEGSEFTVGVFRPAPGVRPCLFRTLFCVLLSVSWAGLFKTAWAGAWCTLAIPLGCCPVESDHLGSEMANPAIAKA